MKKYLGLMLFSLLSLSVKSQKNIAGFWEGILSAGVDLHMVFTITEGNNSYTASLSVPDQGVKDIQATSIVRTKDSIIITIDKVHGKYAGSIRNDSIITGAWTQGHDFPLNIKKVKEIAVAKRPQTPLPPFPYKSEDVVYYASDKSVQYGATITTPPGKGPFPALLLITGSGQQNRDEEILQHRPFAVIADYLTRKGYMVMRVDDRGMGQTTGDLTKATSRDFADDAEVSLDYLKKRKDIDLGKIGLLGHSEGGMIAQIIAAERKEIDFLIFLAAPGEKTTTLMEEQNAAAMKSGGIPQKYTDSYIVLYSSLLPAVTYALSLAEAKQTASMLVDDWIKKTDKSIVIATTGINNEETKNLFINNLIPAMYAPWYRYFLSYNPANYIRKIEAKVLALDGDKDIQVISKTNLPAMQACFKESPSKDVVIKELKGLNHLFQHCYTCTVQEYAQLEETIAPEVLQIIGDWLKDHVSSNR